MFAALSKSFLKGALFEIEEACASPVPPDWADGIRPVSHFILLYVRKGEGELQAAGVTTALRDDSLFLYAPGTVLKLRLQADPPPEMVWIAFDLFLLSGKNGDSRSFVRQTGFPLQGPLQLAPARIRRLMLLLAAKGAQARGRERYAAQQHMHDLLAILLEGAKPAARNALEARLLQTADYMRASYRETVRMEDLAGMAGLHPAYYSQVFKQLMGKTPVAYLTHLRMNKAKELIMEGEMSVREIAADIGYADEFYFSRRFKATAGSPPKAFARRKAERIVSLSAPYTDHLYTLGVVPCAGQLHRHMPRGIAPLRLPEHAVDPWEAEREDFLRLDPDLILCKDNVLPKAREHLGDIAPIACIPWASRDIYRHLQDISALVGREPAAQAWHDAHDAAAQAARRAAREIIGSGTTALCAARRHELRIYGSRNIGHAFYRSLELAAPDRVQEQLRLHPPGTGHNWTSITPDEIRRYEADFLFLFTETPQDRIELEEHIAANPFWASHPAIRSGRFAFLDWGMWILYAPSMIVRQLEELASLLPRLGSCKTHF